MQLINQISNQSVILLFVLQTFAVVLSVLACASAGFLPAENFSPSQSEGYSYPQPEEHYHHGTIIWKINNSSETFRWLIQSIFIAQPQFAVQEVHAAPAPIAVQVHAAPAQHFVEHAPAQHFVEHASAPHFVEHAPAQQIVKVISEPVS